MSDDRHGERKCMYCEKKMRSDVLLRHYKTHWKQTTEAMGAEALAKACEIRNPMIWHRHAGTTQWCWCAVCGKGEARTAMKAKEFNKEHRCACSSGFDAVRYMFDHTQEEPKQTRNRRTKAEILESEDGEKIKVVTKVVTKTLEGASALQLLRQAFPDDLSNKHRNAEYAEAVENDPDEEHDINDYGDDLEAQYDTDAKAIQCIKEELERKRTNEKDLVKDNNALRSQVRKLERERDSEKQAADALREKIMAMQAELDELRRMNEAKNAIFQLHNISDTSDISDRIAQHINACAK